jgi:lysophospholipase L1-like esterase
MKLFTTIILILSSCVLTAQERPFAKEIRQFKTEDSLQRPPKNAIVFVGSSSFRMWKDMQQDFPGYNIINRGFGGSSLPHVIEYADEIVIPYHPKQVVIYCGENDFMNDTVTSEIVANRFITLHNKLREALPRTNIVYVSMKPSPSRQHLMDKISAANATIRNFLKKKRKTAYVDIWNRMLDERGAPQKDLFLSDMLHMNEKGYEIWQKAIRPYLK